MSPNPPDPPNPPKDSKDSTEVIAAQVPLKLPIFWANRAALWFLQCETQFRMRGFKADQTKYDHVISVLPPDIMELISDTLMDPPQGDKYEALKKILIERCQDSETRRLDALLNKVDLGDTRPSELFRKMESLAGDFQLINKQLLKKLWIGKLPSSIQTCLIAIEGTQTPEELFNIADKLYDATEHNKISAVKKENPSEDTGLKKVLDRICSRLEKLENPDSRRERYRDRSHSRNRSNSRTHRNSSKFDTCWYHYKFADRAKKCIEPCKFKSDDLPKNSKNQ